ncbi:MAG: head decoration protein [Vicinamibacterales bacterium]
MSINPGFSSEGSYTPDNLLADAPVGHQTADVTVVSGAGALTRGTLLGKQTASTVPSTGTAGGSNSGGGTMGSVTGGSKTKAGTYRIKCVKVVSSAGDFEVRDPDGYLVGIATTAVAFVSDHLNFTIADGSPDFALGDVFTVAVTGSGKYLKSLAAATDGSQVPVAILARDADATSADVSSPAYIAGGFDERAVVFGTGHTAASVREALRANNIYLQPSVIA